MSGNIILGFRQGSRSSANTLVNTWRINEAGDISYIHSIHVNSHWLHACARRMRWQEEVTITTYEMQWTVHYFIHKSNFWSEIQNTPATDGLTLEVNGNAPGMDVGSLSYAKQKHSTWYQFALKVDKTFKVINNAYKSLCNLFFIYI